VRIDVFFKKTLIFKKREQAKSLCDKQLVRVNGRIAKPSKNIQIGDIIEIDTVAGTRSIKVLDIPRGNVGKHETGRYYEEGSGTGTSGWTA
jgi:ribosomal 50S subunit-recycling heat shock protein